MPMGTWKTRALQKKGRRSQTTGKSKGLVPGALARFMCRRSRSYKHPEYAAVMAGLGQRKVKK